MSMVFDRLVLLELDQVDRHRDVMKASDICQNKHIMTGDSNYGFYYDFTDKDIKALEKLGAELEFFYNVEILEFYNKEDFLDYCNNNSYIDTATTLQSGVPARDYYDVLIQKDNK